MCCCCLSLVFPGAVPWRCSDFFFRILIAGDAGIGKTALLHRFLYDTFTDEKVRTPIGIKHKVSMPPNGRTGGGNSSAYKALSSATSRCRSQDSIMVHLREPFAADDMLAKLFVVSGIS